MAGTRVQIDLYFDGKTPQQVNQEFPALLPAIKAAKAKATKINEGLATEEMTVKATWHLCGHKENKPCGAEQDI